MLVFPVDTDRRLLRTPWVNYALVLTNVVVFFITMWDVHEYKTNLGDLSGAQHTTDALQAMYPVTKFFLWPNAPQIQQFITHQFLHLSWLHLFGNMVFLFVFGNSVEDRLGKIGYLCLYLASGVVAGLLHSMLKVSPILGASGAVAGVTAAYLVLFPLTYVRLFAWVTEFEVSSLIVIVYYILQDVVFNLMGIYRTAYLAHVGGYAFGFVAVVGLLVSGILPREPYDLVQWLRHKHRRAMFRKLSRKKKVWERELPASDGEISQKTGALSETQEILMHEREAIKEAIQRGDLHAAAKLYLALLKASPEQVMAQQDQLDLANQLMQETSYEPAAVAYELFLDRYMDYDQRASVELILGLLYARYLQSPIRARELLVRAQPELTGDNTDLCQAILDEVPSPTVPRPLRRK